MEVRTSIDGFEKTWMVLLARCLINDGAMEGNAWVVITRETSGY